MTTLRVLTWHVHGNYLLYLLSRARVEFYPPVDPAREVGYGGRGSTFPFSENVREVPSWPTVRRSPPGQQFDCILLQSRRNYLVDCFGILSEEHIDRFARDWEETFQWVTGKTLNGQSVAISGANLAMGKTFGRTGPVGPEGGIAWWNN